LNPKVERQTEPNSKCPNSGSIQVFGFDPETNFNSGFEFILVFVLQNPKRPNISKFIELHVYLEYI
jgi:hypothetical protein